MTDRARELLERALECWELQLFGAANCGFKTFEEIRAYLADTNPSETINSQEVDRSEPVAWAEYDPRGNLCALHRSFGDGLSKAEIEYGWKLEPLYLHPAPRPEWLDLTEDEAHEVFKKWGRQRKLPPDIYGYCLFIGAALKKKNSPTILSLNDKISANSRDSGHE